MYDVYILRCPDDSLYVGYTTNLEARIKAHNQALARSTPSTAAPWISSTRKSGPRGSTLSDASAN